jgi:YggT family protein
MTTYLITFVELLFNILQFAIIIRALMSWFNPSPDNPIVQLVMNITEPVLAPLRRIVPKLGMVDITPIVAILLMGAIQNVLLYVLSGRG